MDHSSIENAITISPDAPISDYSWEGNTLTITFSSDLNPDTEYTVTIGTEAKDPAGNALQAPFSRKFTTKAEFEEEFPLMWLITIPLLIIGILVFLYIGKAKSKSHELEPETLETEIKLGVFSAKKKYHYKEETKDEPSEEASEEETDKTAPTGPDEEN